MSVLARAAAALIALAGASAPVTVAAHHDRAQEHARKVVQVVFVLDTTGSMAPLIEGAKRKIWSIATAIVDQNPNAEVQMGLVAYRDVGDEYVTRIFPLTTDIQGLYGELLDFKARGGGDWPESVNEALFLAVTKTGWSTDPAADRIVFLVGDAPPHMDYPQDRKYTESLEIARKSTILVNAVQAGAARDTERVWRTIAQLGNGRYIPIPQDGGRVLAVDTPFDREIIELQIEINRTIVPYGSPQRQGAVRSKADGIRSAPAAVATDMAGYMSKVGKGRRCGDRGGGPRRRRGVRPARPRRRQGRGTARRVPPAPPGRAPGGPRRAPAPARAARRADGGSRPAPRCLPGAGRRGGAGEAGQLRRRREGHAAQPDEALASAAATQPPGADPARVRSRHVARLQHPGMFPILPPAARHSAAFPP
jgi:Mg-chelatase subunit ChlD